MLHFLAGGLCRFCTALSLPIVILQRERAPEISVWVVCADSAQYFWQAMHMCIQCSRIIEKNAFSLHRTGVIISIIIFLGISLSAQYT